MFSKKCKLHLEEADMTRWQHFKHAMGIAWRLKKAALAVFLHAFAPRYFKKYASETCKDIAKEN
mgnify:FL=1|jgi:hypothetical protein|tara:strand:- start:214 stop:405 length:192 start_codon:yes stop_codon:yes gene_type:complete